MNGAAGDARAPRRRRSGKGWIVGGAFVLIWVAAVVAVYVVIVQLKRTGPAGLRQPGPAAAGGAPAGAEGVEEPAEGKQDR